METTIQIKSTYGDVLYEHTCEDNSVKKTVEKAVKNNISLQGADLLASVLYGAKLRYADLRGADLREADLYNADLFGADLRSADLSGSNLCEAHLSGAYLSNVKADHTTSMFFPQCPDGAFIGYKKADGKIVKLLIPADAKRSSGTTLKCRCSKAKVLEIQEIDGSPSEVKEGGRNLITTSSTASERLSVWRTSTMIDGMNVQLAFISSYQEKRR